MSVNVNGHYGHQLGSNVITVWLDSYVHTTKDCLETQKYLRRIFTNLIVFDDMDACSKYISSVPTEKIFLIVSGKFGAMIVPLIHALEQVASIYIFCANKLSHERWAKDYCKIRGVFDDSSFLLSKLCLTVTSRFNNSSPISIFNTTDSTEKSIRNLNKQSTTFMWFQLLLEVLLRMPQTDKSQSEMLNFCRSMYKDNDQELEKIAEFEEHYVPSQAIFWYTRDCFLYRLMNKLMRTENIDMIYTFRYFIRDLHYELGRLHSEDIESSEKSLRSSIVYRGQRMSAVELEELKENVHHLIAMNTFLSTTLQKDVAIVYAGDCNECPYVEAVLFEIDISRTDGMNTKPFSKITKHSSFAEEDEVLFSMGAIFQIDSVNQLPDGMWIIKLHLTSIEDKQLTHLSEYMTKNIREETTVLDLGNVLLTMGEDDKAVEYFKMFLNEDPLNHKDKSYIYTQIGHIHFRKDEYESALSYYETALEYQGSSQPPNYLWLPQAYENIGCTNEKLGQNHIALQYYRQQLQLYLDCAEPNKDLIMKVEQKLNFLYNESDNFDEKELEYQNQKLDIYLKLRPANHPDLIQIYSNIGFTYSRSNNYVNASSNYEKALEVSLLSLPPNHDQTKIAYYNVAYCQYKNGNYENALKNYEKAIQLELTCQSPKVLLIAKIYNGRGHVYFQQKDYQNAAQNYEQAVQICWKNSTPHPKYDQNLGHVYLESGEYEKAMEVLEKALQIEEDSSSPETVMIIALYTSIGNACFALKNYISAINNYQKAFDAYEYISTLKNDIIRIRKVADDEMLHYLIKSLPDMADDNESTARQYQKIIETCFQQSKEIGKATELISTVNQSHDDFIVTENYEDLIEACIQNKEFVNALEICEKVLGIKLNQPLKNIPSLSAIYIAISRIYYEMKNYHLSTTYFEKCLELISDSLPMDASVISTLCQVVEYVLCINEHYEDALRLCSTVLTIELTRQPPLQINIALVHGTIGRIYCAMKQYETAIESFGRGIDISTPCLPEQKKYVETFFEYLQNAYSESGNFEQAIECCTKLLALKLEWDPGNLLSLAEVYSKLASLNFEKSNYQVSIDNWKKVVEIRLMLSPVNYYLITKTYTDLVRASLKDSNNIQALMYCERALESEQRSESPRAPWIAFIYNDIGKIHHIQTDYELSIQSYTRAIKILGEGTHIETAYFDNLAGSYKMAERYDEAIENYNQALQIKLQRTPLESLTIAQSYANLGSVYFNKENYEMSINNYEKAIQISMSLNPLPECLISWYGDLSEVYYTSNDFEKAQLICELALQKEQYILHLDPLILIEIYNHLSCIYYLKCIYATALIWGRKVLDMRLTHLKLNDGMIGQAFNNIGKVLYRMGLYDESLTNYQNATEIYFKSKSTCSYDCADTYRNIGELHEICYQFNESTEVYEKSIEILLTQRPLDSDFYLFYIKVLPKYRDFHILKHLTVMRNLAEMHLE